MNSIFALPAIIELFSCSSTHSEVGGQDEFPFGSPLRITLADHPPPDSPTVKLPSIQLTISPEPVWAAITETSSEKLPLRL